MNPAASPITSAASGGTYPAAGVIVASPATAPVAAPIVVTLPVRMRSGTIQPSSAAAAPSWVFTKALEASAFEASALPALKPNQPNHKIPAPKITNGTLCGVMSSVPCPRRFPR